ncbi:helix-turn-helix domain-containing protein [Streptomyces bluensis]|uniref:helix-turn-helix domain-containing protein n=1 Tax=Streptomyces bluensis TaxID=33897 RepID=UPI00331FFFB1
MPTTDTIREAGQRIAATRRARRMTQDDLARSSFVSLSMLRKIEQGTRFPSDDTLDALAAALHVDPSRLLTGHQRVDNRVHDALPAVSAAIAAHDDPDDGPVRALARLQEAVEEAVTWRLGSQYVQISRNIPGLLAELSRALHSAPPAEQPRVVSPLVRAYRCADAVAYKFAARAHRSGLRALEQAIDTSRPPGDARDRCPRRSPHAGRCHRQPGRQPGRR